MNSPQDTIAAIATPLGVGGLGVIRLSGPQAVSTVSQIFHGFKTKDLTQAAPNSCHVGAICTDVPLDQVIVTVFRAPQSYTGEEVVEISAHGSPFVLGKILALCVQKGARLAGPGEFTERAFVNGKIDLTQAEAVAELISAKTDKTHAAALSQVQGGLSRKVRRLRDSLLPLLAHIEVGLDHSDEDHDFLARTDLTTRCGAVQKEIDSLLQSARVSKILREGLRVALVGRPNVGKSSLLNALLKEERAIVTPTPGTTRDTLEESVNWNGIPVILTDTAGLRRASADPVEQLGIERTLRALAEADIILTVFDGSEPLTPEDQEVISACADKPQVWVINKRDLPARWEISHLRPLRSVPSPLVGEGWDGGKMAVLAPPPASSPTRGRNISKLPPRPDRDSTNSFKPSPAWPSMKELRLPRPNGF